MYFDTVSGGKKVYGIAVNSVNMCLQVTAAQFWNLRVYFHESDMTFGKVS